MTIRIRYPETGQELEVTEETFKDVYEAQGYERVDAAATLDGMTREELNAHAASVGVEDADKLPNKAAVIEAIEGARAPEE